MSDKLVVTKKSICIMSNTIYPVVPMDLKTDPPPTSSITLKKEKKKEEEKNL